MRRRRPLSRGRRGQCMRAEAMSRRVASKSLFDPRPRSGRNRLKTLSSPLDCLHANFTNYCVASHCRRDAGFTFDLTTGRISRYIL